MSEYAFNQSALESFLRAALDFSDDGVCRDGVCYELRILRARFQEGGTRMVVPAEDTDKPWANTIGGFYTDAGRLVMDAARLDGVSGYIGINPLRGEWAARGKNTLRYLTKRSGVDDHPAACDSDVVSLDYLFVDIDSARESGGPATDAEHAEALELRDKILRDEPAIRAASLWGSSGNGGWILVRLKGYEGDPDRARKRKDFLECLADKYGRAGHDRAFIDTNTSNPSHTMPCPGTKKCKANETPETPWRLVTLDGRGGIFPKG